MQVFVTRHGHTEWNVLKKVQSRNDLPLNETGIEKQDRLVII